MLIWPRWLIESEHAAAMPRKTNGFRKNGGKKEKLVSFAIHLIQSPWEKGFPFLPWRINKKNAHGQIVDIFSVEKVVELIDGIK